MRRAFLESGGTKGVVLAVIWVPVAIVVAPMLAIVRLVNPTMNG
jgi:hypothetical protein